MARKPPSPTAPPPRLELNEPASSARSKLAERVLKGEELRARVLPTYADVEALKRDHGKWRSYNAMLLRTMFSTPEIEHEYVRSAYDGNVTISLDGYGRTGDDEPGQTYRQIVAEIACLTSIIERLELFPNPATGHTKDLAPQRTRDLSRAFVVHGHDEAALASVARPLE